ncbi:MAG: hypothetical protein M0P70_10130 [Desulfobulbaceae bacterium]|nr:hypothetical protein [Desulfobulbaceae bacterium]
MKTIEEVFKEEPSYIKWCLEKVEHFCLVPEELAQLNPEDSQKRIGGKLRKINHERFESLELNNAVDPTTA